MIKYTTQYFKIFNRGIFLAKNLSLDQETKENINLKEPKKFKVLLLNDDFSTMDFVIEVLMNIFHKPFDDALNIMLSIHKQGKGICGIYTFEIAETKITQVRKIAKKHGYPLRAVLEEA